MKKIILPASILVIGIILTAVGLLTADNASGELDVSIEKTSFIMPAAHRVYENPNALGGKHYLFKAKITNNSTETLEDVTVRYRIPNYVEWTELDVSGLMFPGQTLVVPCYPKFEEKITKKTTESIEKAEIEISWDGATEDDIIEEAFTFKLTNRNDYVYTSIPVAERSSWSDTFDNSSLIACFVTPNDPVVKYYTQNLQEKLMKGEQASVTNKAEDGVRLLTSIYEATRQSHMVYSGTKGIPQSIDDAKSLVQHVRLPREVITGNTGLCIELSCLYASVLSAAGLDPIIYLVPGHAYPGFKMNGQFYAIEATSIGGEGIGNIASAKEAFEKGQKQLQEFTKRAQAGDSRYTLVDIHALNEQGVTAMNLDDSDFLREKVDDIVASWSSGTKNIPGTKPTKNNIQLADDSFRTGTGTGTDTGTNTGTGTNALSFAVPPGWHTRSMPLPELPILTAEVTSPDNMTTVSVFDVPASNPQEALQVINQYLSGYGMNMDYQINGNRIDGQTFSANGTFSWVAKALRRQGGIRLVAIGAPDYAYQQQQSTINRILNSIK